MDSPENTSDESATDDIDTAASTNQLDQDEDSRGGFIFDNDLESNGSDETHQAGNLAEREQERVIDIVRLQPTKNAELQDQWGLDSGKEVHQYLKSKLSDYYYRDDDSYIRATDKAEEFVQHNQELYQNVTQSDEDSEDQVSDLRRRDLVLALVTLTQELGHLPSAEEIDDHGEYPQQRYQEEFGDLFTAYQQAGLLPDDVTRADFYGEEESEPTPEYESEEVDDGGQTSETADDEASTEDERVETSEIGGGRPDFEVPEEIDEADLINEVQRFADILDEPPTEELVAAYGRYPVEEYQDRFESWTATLEAAGCDPDDLPDWSRRLHSNVDVLDGLRAVADELGHAPTTTETGSHVDFSPGLASLRFGSWTGALQTAGLDPDERSSAQPDETVQEDNEQADSETDSQTEDADVENEEDDSISSMIDETLEEMLLSDDDDTPV